MARTLITEDTKIILAEPADKKLVEDIVVKHVENQSQDDECHVSFDCEILDGETHEEATKPEVVDYIKQVYDDLSWPEDDDLHLELWTQSSTEEDIKRDISEYIEGHYDGFSLFVPQDKIKIIHAELWRFPDYDEVNKIATKRLMDLIKSKNIPGIEFNSERLDGFVFKTDGAEIWYQAEVADITDVDAALKESYKESHKSLHEEKYSDSWVETLESAFEEAGLSFERFNEAGILSKNIGWKVDVDGKEVYLSCDGTWLDESKKVTEAHGKGFVERYKGYAIHDVGDRYVITDESGATVEETKWGLPICRAIIDELVEKKPVKEDLPDAKPEEPITVSTKPEVDKETIKNAIIAQLNSAIQREFEGIDAINGLIAMVKEVFADEPELTEILNGIVDDKSFTVGVIQGAIAKVDPKMSEMNDAGKTQVTGDPTPTDAITVLDDIEGE